MFYYRVCGLAVASSLELSAAIEIDTVEQVDVNIRQGVVPVSLDNARGSGPNWMMAGDGFLLKVPGVARFLIVAGRDLSVENEAGADEEEALPFLLGTAFSILLYQRRRLALHASAVAVNGRSILFCGNSGMGKSTLSAALCQAGCDFVNDDLCAVDFDAQNRPEVRPDGRRLKLWKDTLDHLGMAAQPRDLIRSKLHKYYVDPPRVTDFNAPLPIAAIYVLREFRPSLTKGIESLSLADSAQVLSAQIYRHRLVQAFGLEADHFVFTASIVAHARIFWLTYPRNLNQLGGLVELLKDHWRSLE